jgi:hypothetical protein
VILDTTYKSHENNNLINDLVGTPFSFMQSIKMKGVYCKNLLIEDVSPNFKGYLNRKSDNYSNLELRPFGIIIKINKDFKNYSWVIPYYQLVIYKINGSSLHAQGRYIHFKNNKTFKKNKLFFEKLLDEKIKYESQYCFTPF